METLLDHMKQREKILSIEIERLEAQLSEVQYWIGAVVRQQKFDEEQKLDEEQQHATTREDNTAALVGSQP